MAAADLIGEWEAYYIASVGAAAVLLGLVFVGLSLHFERDRGPFRFRGLAIQSAACLFYALLVSLTMLVPQSRPMSQGVILSVVALFGIWTSSVAFAEARSAKTTALALGFRFVLPLTLMVVLLAAAIAMTLDNRVGVWVVGAVVFLHILVGTQNAWDLFLGAGTSDSRPGPT